MFVVTRRQQQSVVVDEDGDVIWGSVFAQDGNTVEVVRGAVAIFGNAVDLGRCLYFFH